MCEFSNIVENDCNKLLAKSNFSKLMPILYQHSGSKYCIEWIKKSADAGHGPLLYMLVRDSYYRTGAGKLEIVGDDLTLTLERIMKFIICLEQDVACCQDVLGHEVDNSIYINFKQKIHGWFANTIRGNNLNEFKQALHNVTLWFGKFLDYENVGLPSPFDFTQVLNNNNASGYQPFDFPSPKCVLQLGAYDNNLLPLYMPSPLWIQLMSWGSYATLNPNTIIYSAADKKLKEIYTRESSRKEFRKKRDEVLQKQLRDLEETKSAQAFITQLGAQAPQLTSYIDLSTVTKVASKALSLYFFGK